MSNEDTIVYVFLYDDKKLTETVINILAKIKDIDIINKIIIDSNASILRHNTKGIVINPQDLPVFLIARTGHKTVVYTGTIEYTDKVINLVNSLWKK